MTCVWCLASDSDCELEGATPLPTSALRQDIPPGIKHKKKLAKTRRHGLFLYYAEFDDIELYFFSNHCTLVTL